MEFCEDGDLYEWRKKNLGQDGLLEEKFIIEILRQIAKGLKYLHGKSMGHRDIDPKNILVKNGQIKIVDFGHSFKQNARSKAAITVTGKELYAAPEAFKKKDYIP